jgi:hypothetical protein
VDTRAAIVTGASNGICSGAVLPHLLPVNLAGFL